MKVNYFYKTRSPSRLMSMMAVVYTTATADSITPVINSLKALMVRSFALKSFLLPVPFLTVIILHRLKKNGGVPQKKETTPTLLI